MDLSSRLVGIISEKDLHSKITYCNDVFLAYAGLRSLDQVYGCTDYDFIWHDYAGIYRAHEIETLSGIESSKLIPLRTSGGSTPLFLHTKVQIKDALGHAIGVRCHTHEIINPDYHNLMHLLDKNYSEGINAYNTYTSLYELTNKEVEILFYLSRGKKAKTIARLLNRSIRTIENHIANMKVKLHCNSQADLIIYAMMKGIHNTLPHDSICNLINKIKE